MILCVVTARVAAVVHGSSCRYLDISLMVPTEFMPSGSYTADYTMLRGLEGLGLGSTSGDTSFVPVVGLVWRCGCASLDLTLSSILTTDKVPDERPHCSSAHIMSNANGMTSLPQTTTDPTTAIIRHAQLPVLKYAVRRDRWMCNLCLPADPFACQHHQHLTSTCRLRGGARARRPIPHRRFLPRLQRPLPSPPTAMRCEHHGPHHLPGTRVPFGCRVVSELFDQPGGRLEVWNRCGCREPRSA